MTQDSGMLSLLFVDDHPLYREGLRLALAVAEPSLHVRVADGEVSALAALATTPEPDLCLVDYRLGAGNGLDLLAKIGTQYPSVARGLLCAQPTPEIVARAQALGCVACLSKDRDAQTLAEALTQLFDGGTIFDVPGAGSVGPALTTKRLEILRLAAQGQSNKEIARSLGITERTVKDHWMYIFEQLGVSHRAEAVSLAHRTNML